MKTKEELCELKNEVNKLNQKLSELSEEELKEVFGGYDGYEHREIDNHMYYTDDYADNRI